MATFKRSFGVCINQPFEFPSSAILVTKHADVTEDGIVINPDTLKKFSFKTYITDDSVYVVPERPDHVFDPLLLGIVKPKNCRLHDKKR